MTYRGKYETSDRHVRRRGCLTFVLVLLILALLAVGATALYCHLTGTEDGALTKLSELLQTVTVRLGLRDELESNPYRPEEYSLQSGRVCLDGARTGVDVSAHQGEIDWDAVAADGIDFAILRIGYRGWDEGGVFADERFRENLERARAAGLDVGVYFYSQAVTADEARQEAQFVLDCLAGQTLDYPVFFDWEESGSEARTAQLDDETLTACAVAFCDTVAGAGYRAGCYFNQALGYRRLDLKQLREHAFWLAEYDTHQSFLYRVQLWQYTNSGSVAGITGPVDLDLCYPDLVPA